MLSPYEAQRARFRICIRCRNKDFFFRVANCERKIKMKKQNTLVVSVQTALLVALEIVLDRFCSFKTFDLKIGFAFVPVMPMQL